MMTPTNPEIAMIRATITACRRPILAIRTVESVGAAVESIGFTFESAAVRGSADREFPESARGTAESVKPAGLALNRLDSAIESAGFIDGLAGLDRLLSLFIGGAD